MEVALPWLQIVLMTIASWIGGALWFGPLFGKMWMKIHHGEHILSKWEMEEMKKGMAILLVSELVATFVMMMTLAFLIKMLPWFSGMHIALMVWIGFILPMTVSNVLWWAEKKKMMLPKIILASSYRLIMLLLAGYLYSGW